jgi:hypothetical protein
MKVKTINAINEPTVAEQQAAIKWLEDAAVSTSSESEQSIQAKNALEVMKLYQNIIMAEKNLLMANQPESITARLGRIVCDFQDEVCGASEKPNASLHKNLTELVKEFGHKAVQAAVDASEDDLSVDDGADTSLAEALLFVLETEFPDCLNDE